MSIYYVWTQPYQFGAKVHSKTKIQANNRYRKKKRKAKIVRYLIETEIVNIFELNEDKCIFILS